MKITENRKTDLERAIELFLKKDKNSNNDKEIYSLCYRFTNENINDVVEQLRIVPNSKLLAVLASGDQAFNFLLAGVTKIDTFDINRFTEYYGLGFKKTAIQVLSYREFLELFSFGGSMNKKGLEKEKFIVQCAPEKYKCFWQEYFYVLKQYGVDASVFDLTKGLNINIVQKKGLNNYLKNEYEYKRLQLLLANIDLSFKELDLTKLPKEFGKYDYVFISNILDSYNNYYCKENFKDIFRILNKIYAKNVQKNGELILTSFEDNGFIDSLNDILKSLEKKGSEKQIYHDTIPITLSLKKK